MIKRLLSTLFWRRRPEYQQAMADIATFSGNLPAVGSNPYPVIMNGDHAQFELDHQGVPPEQRPDWPLPSFDARDWARAFCKIANERGITDSHGEPIDEGWMISWFANALMRGYYEHARR